jgi:hypothetical protein
MPFGCHICNSREHIVYECNASHLQSMTVFIRDFIKSIFDRIYNNEYSENIYWVAELDIFKDLSLGELLYLNRNITINGSILTNRREVQIYLFIYDSLKQYHNTSNYSPIIMEGLTIDIEYWYCLLYQLETPEYANRVRYAKWSSLDGSYWFVQGTAPEGVIECPICLTEKECIESHRFNCNHSICIPCSNRLLIRHSVKCPLCRIQIQQVTYYN